MLGVGALHRIPGWFETSPYEGIVAGAGMLWMWGMGVAPPRPWVPDRSRGWR